MNTDKKYKVALTAHGNIDHGANPYEMVAPPQIVFADTIEELQQAVRDYIEEYDLGGGNWTGGQVSDTATGKKSGIFLTIVGIGKKLLKGMMKNERLHFQKNQRV